MLFQVKSKTDSLVAQFQDVSGYADASMRTVHAAICLGHNAVVHATPFDVAKLKFGGVRIENFKKLVPDRSIYLLRDNNLTLESRLKIALFAATLSRHEHTYDYKQILTCIFALADSSGSGGVYHRFGSVLSKFFHRTEADGVTKFGNHEIVEPSVPLGNYWANNIDDVDSDGVFNDRGGLASFVCSDLVLHCYSTILGSDNLFTRSSVLKTPFFLPADIFENSELEEIISADTATASAQAASQSTKPSQAAGDAKA